MTSEQIEIVNNIKFSIIKAIDNIESEQMWEMIEKAYEQKEKDHCEDYLKKRDKDYVHYNVKWLLDNWEQELELLSGGKIKTCEDCISREEVMRILKTLYEFDELKDLKAKQREVMNLPSVTPKPNRCDSCTHSEEQDGSNCYECVKGMADNFETQQTEMRDATEEERKSVRDYIRSISKPTGVQFETQPTDADYVSREEVMKLLEKEDWADTVYGVMNLPSVKLPRPKSKWNYINEHARRYRVCSNCGYTKEDDKFYGWYFCPNCGAEMEIENEKETC